MAEKRPTTRQSQLVHDLVSGLLEQKDDLGPESDRLVQLLRAAGYSDCEQIRSACLINCPPSDDDDSRHH